MENINNDLSIDTCKISNAVNEDNILQEILKERAYSKQKLYSVTNTIYIVTVTENKILTEQEDYMNNDNTINSKLFFSQSKEFKFIFRIYGIASESGFIDRELELKIISHLSKRNLTARIIYAEDKFRMEEFLEGYSNSNRLDILSDLPKILSIIADYNLIDTMMYKKTLDDIEISKPNTDIFKIIDEKTEGEFFTLKQPDNFIIKFIEKILINVKNHFKEVVKTYEKLDEERINRAITFDTFTYRFEKIKKLQNFLNKVDDSFMFNILPQTGIICLCHNDIHVLNIMSKNIKTGIPHEDFKFIDIEFSRLNLIGVDVANFFFECSFDYTKSPYSYEKFNLEKYHEHFKFYIDYVFCKISIKDNDVDKLKNYLLSIDYFKVLVVYSIMVWTSGIVYIKQLKENLDYYISKSNNPFEEEGFDYLDYLLDRISVFKDCGYKEF